RRPGHAESRWWLRGDRPDARDVPGEEGPAAGRSGRRRVIPVWAQLTYLGAAACFVLALKGLSSPRTARAGNLLGAAAALVAMVVTFIVYDLDHLGLIRAADAVEQRHQLRHGGPP